METRVLLWLPLMATQLLIWTVPGVHASPTKMLIARINVQDYFKQGKVLLDHQDYQGAIANFTQVIRLQPNHSGAYLLRGDAHASLEDYPGAIADYTQAIRFEPNNAGAYSGRGSARKLLKDYQGAITDYTQASRLDPSNAAAYILLRVYASKSLNDYRAAITNPGYSPLP
ncbi:MAG TPA: tetratricopeptide repeat protein [Methylococcales bacterium]